MHKKNNWKLNIKKIWIIRKSGIQTWYWNYERMRHDHDIKEEVPLNQN
jgi:hypothetical protein